MRCGNCEAVRGFWSQVRALLTADKNRRFRNRSQLRKRADVFNGSKTGQAKHHLEQESLKGERVMPAQAACEPDETKRSGEKRAVDRNSGAACDSVRAMLGVRRRTRHNLNVKSVPRSP